MLKLRSKKLRPLYVTVGRGAKWKAAAEHFQYKPVRGDEWKDGKEKTVVKRDRHTNSHIDIIIEEIEHEH